MNYDPQNENLYLRLDLSSDATLAEVKKSFFRAVRVYPPEQKPDDFKNIREAYDILINDQSRKEYDSKSQFGEEINDLEEKINIAENDSDTENLIKLYKKLIVLAPEISIYRNRLGLEFLNNEQPENGEKQFRKAIELNPENSVFLTNLGHALQSKGDFENSEKRFIEAWDLEEEDYSAPRALAQLYYHDMDKKEKAHEVLDRSINADGIVDFQDFFCIFDKIHFYALSNDDSNLEKELELIIKISVKREEKDFSAFMLMRTSSHLYDLKIYELASKFSKVALELDPDNTLIQDYIKNLEYNLNYIKQYNIVMSSSDIHDMIKEYINLMFLSYFNEISKTDFNKRLSEYQEIFSILINTRPEKSKMQQSLKKIKYDYKTIFEINPEFFNGIINDNRICQYYLGTCPYCNEKFKVPDYIMPYFDFTNERLTTNKTAEYDCPHCNNTVIYDSKSFSKSGFCFITSAICYALDKTDDCFILNVFRSFRDNWLIKQKNGYKLIKQYYEIAPKIVKAIDKLNNSKVIYVNIWNNYLNICYKFIIEKEYIKAKKIYIQMVKMLENKYLSL